MEIYDIIGLIFEIKEEKLLIMIKTESNLVI